MRILQVVSDTDRRGAQVFATDLAVALEARGHDVDTLALEPGGVGGLDVEVGARRWPSIAAVTALRRRMAGADVTVAHGSSTGPACALAGIGRDRPFVYRQISDTRFWARTRARRLRVRAALSRAQRVIALSQFNRSELVEWIGLPDERIDIIPNGVPTAQFAPTDGPARASARAALGLGDEPVVLYVGALAPEKGVDLAIRAVGTLADARLVIAGAGPEQPSLERLAAEVAAGRVQFVGSTDAPASLYHAADLLVLPSRGGDAMPAVLIEAGLCGLATVSTQIGAIPEVVLDGTTGRVVAADDGPALTDAVASLLDDARARATLGAAARAHCLAHYDIARVAESWEAALTRAVRSGPSRD